MSPNPDEWLGVWLCVLKTAVRVTSCGLLWFPVEEGKAPRCQCVPSEYQLSLSYKVDSLLPPPGDGLAQTWSGYCHVLPLFSCTCTAGKNSTDHRQEPVVLVGSQDPFAHLDSNH